MATTTTALPLRTAMESRDVRAVVESFTPDAVFHSPLTSKINFRGRDQIGRLTEVIFEVFEDFHYVDEVRRRGDGLPRRRGPGGGHGHRDGGPPPTHFRRCRRRMHRVHAAAPRRRGSRSE